MQSIVNWLYTTKKAISDKILVVRVSYKTNTLGHYLKYNNLREYRIYLKIWGTWKIWKQFLPESKKEYDIQTKLSFTNNSSNASEMSFQLREAFFELKTLGYAAEPICVSLEVFWCSSVF